MNVVLGLGVASVIAAEAAASRDGLETGGILLGHDDGAELVVTLAGGPGPTADRKPTTFVRDLAHAQGLGDEAYTTDGSVWIGEWHTHPGGLQIPSKTDMATYDALLADDGLGFERILTLIVVPCPAHGWAETLVYPWLVDAAGAHPVAVTDTAAGPPARVDTTEHGSDARGAAEQTPATEERT